MHRILGESRLGEGGARQRVVGSWCQGQGLNYVPSTRVRKGKISQEIFGKDALGHSENAFGVN